MAGKRTLANVNCGSRVLIGSRMISSVSVMDVIALLSKAQKPN